MPFFSIKICLGLPSSSDGCREGMGLQGYGSVVSAYGAKWRRNLPARQATKRANWPEPAVCFEIFLEEPMGGGVALIACSKATNVMGKMTSGLPPRALVAFHIAVREARNGALGRTFGGGGRGEGWIRSPKPARPLHRLIVLQILSDCEKR